MVALTSIEANAHISAQARAAEAVALIGKDKLFVVKSETARLLP